DGSPRLAGGDRIWDEPLRKGSFPGMVGRREGAQAARRGHGCFQEILLMGWTARRHTTGGRCRSVHVAGLLSLVTACGTASAADKAVLQYTRDIRPILAENCFPCHGPDSAARKADLRLDRREAAIEAGAITPGDVESSELIARINSPDPKEVMPPK